MFAKIKKLFADYEELKFLAYHDPLTGLFNRNWLYKNKETIKCRYVYFIDINDLTKVNRDGHTAGDLYIKTVIDSIKFITNDDIFVRYGGDEFILFSDRSILIETNYIYSVGFAEVSKNLNISDAIDKADKEMIKSKAEFKKNLVK